MVVENQVLLLTPLDITNTILYIRELNNQQAGEIPVDAAVTGIFLVANIEETAPPPHPTPSTCANF